MRLLESRYGDPLKILTSYRREILKWPSIRAGDATASRQFHNFLLAYESVISMQSWNALTSPEKLSKIKSKFPRHVRYKWNRKVLNLRKRQIKEPTLSDYLLLLRKSQVDERKKFLMKSKFCFDSYDVISKKHSGKNCPTRKSAAFAKSKIPVGYTACKQTKGYLKKKMTTTLVQCHQETRKRKIV